MPNANISKELFLEIIGVFFFSCNNAIALGFSISIPVHQILFVRSGFYLLFLCIFCGKGFLHKNSLQQLSNFPLYLYRCIAITAATYAFVASIRYIPLAEATLLHMTAPFYIPLIGMLWLKEKNSWKIWPILALGFYGTFLICAPSAYVFQNGTIFALTSGILSAISLSLLRKLNKLNESVIHIALFPAVFGVIVNGCACLFEWHIMSVKEWILGATGGFCIGINQLCITYAYRFATASALAPLNYIAFPFSAVIGWIIFAQPIAFTTFLGALLICVSGIWTYRVHLDRQTLQE